MGGKTQQRVAGNVKPSSSGRIRDLLINKHGVGKIITFSTLSEQQSAVSEAESKDLEDVCHKTNSKDTTGEIPASPQTSPSNKPALVTKKVGGRDLFVRVRVDKNQTEQASTETNVNSLNESNDIKVGVFKPTEQQNFSDVNSTSILKEEEEYLEAQESDTVEEEKVFDFDTVLEQLNQVQYSLGREAVYCLENLDENRIAQEMELLKMLSILIVNFKDELSIEEWDVVNSSIYKWIGMISRSDKEISDCSTRSQFCVEVFDFIYNLISLAKDLKKNENLEVEFPMLQSILDDWNNFYSSNIYQDLIILYFKLVRKSNPNQEHLQVLGALACILVEVDPRLVIFNPSIVSYLEPLVECDPDFKQPKNSRYCCIDEKKFQGFLAMSNLLKSNFREVLVSAHSMLNKIMDDICESSDVTSIISEQDDIDSILILPPVALMSALTAKDSIMTALLSDYRVGDTSVTIEPNTDSYSCALGYLFVWDLTIKFIVGVDKEVGQCIIHSLKKLGLIQRLLDNVFMLVPPLGERDLLNFKKGSDKLVTGDWSLSTFLKSPLKTSMKRAANEIELTALHIYFSVALHMPVTVRKWYNNNSNKKLCNLVNEYTTKHISQVICSLEMDTVQEKCQERANEDKLNNLVIKARPSAREVYAIYTRDEFKMELTIKLPINYPLGPVQIDGGKRVGVTDLKWRSWLLQLTTFLSHQNGQILDGIDLWRRNIDKRFEGIEKCMICFSILHSNYQLPKKKCLTCSKIFHSLCLYKWFENSGNSTCPGCRSIM